MVHETFVLPTRYDGETLKKVHYRCIFIHSLKKKKILTTTKFLLFEKNVPRLFFFWSCKQSDKFLFHMCICNFYNNSMIFVRLQLPMWFHFFLFVTVHPLLNAKKPKHVILFTKIFLKIISFKIVQKSFL